MAVGSWLDLAVLADLSPPADIHLSEDGDTHGWLVWLLVGLIAALGVVWILLRRKMAAHQAPSTSFRAKPSRSASEEGPPGDG